MDAKIQQHQQQQQLAASLSDPAVAQLVAQLGQLLQTAPAATQQAAPVMPHFMQLGTDVVAAKDANLNCADHETATGLNGFLQSCDKLGVIPHLHKVDAKLNGQPDPKRAVACNRLQGLASHATFASTHDQRVAGKAIRIGLPAKMDYNPGQMSQRTVLVSSPVRISDLVSGKGALVPLGKAGTQEDETMRAQVYAADVGHLSATGLLSGFVSVELGQLVDGEFKSMDNAHVVGGGPPVGNPTFDKNGERINAFASIQTPGGAHQSTKVFRATTAGPAVLGPDNERNLGLIAENGLGIVASLPSTGHPDVGAMSVPNNHFGESATMATLMGHCLYTNKPTGKQPRLTLTVHKSAATQALRAIAQPTLDSIVDPAKLCLRAKLVGHTVGDRVPLTPLAGMTSNVNQLLKGSVHLQGTVGLHLRSVPKPHADWYKSAE